MPAVRRLAEARFAPARQVSAPAGGKPLTVTGLFDRRPSLARRPHARLSALSLSRRLAGSLPSAALLMIRAPLNPSIAYDWSKPPSSYHGCRAVSTSELFYARFLRPVIRRRMPLRNRGAFTHTMRTFMPSSPPAHTDQQKPRAHQQAACQRRPGPARNAQKQHKEPQPDQRKADDLSCPDALTVRSLRRAAATSMMHGHPPFHPEVMCPIRRT